VAAVALTRLRAGPAYAVAAGWGFFGIAVKAAEQSLPVTLAAAAGIAALAALAFATRRL
jgi:hypothetical protein